MTGIDLGALSHNVQRIDPQEAPAQKKVKTLADFTVEHVRWLWYGRLAAGKVTLIDGDPGDNKSTLGLDLAARLTTGRPLPTFDGTQRERQPVAVALMTAEDDPSDTVLPRFLAARGDASLAAWVPQMVPYVNDAGEPVQVPTVIPGDLEMVESIVSAVGAKLLVVDPLSAYIGSGVDTHRDNEVRAVLRPLADMAARTGISVLAVRHFTKHGSGRALHRGGGSVGFIAGARVGMTVVRDPDADDVRLLSVSKCNLAREQPTLRYRITTHDELDQPVVQWLGIDDRSADDLVNHDEDRSEAERLILEQLAEGPRPAKEVLAAAREEGIARSTLMRAKKRLGVDSAKEGMHDGWVWLPPKSPEGSKNNLLDPSGPFGVDGGAV